MTKPKAKPNKKPTTAQQLARLDRRITAMHAANVKQNTSTALDLGALTVNLNQVRERLDELGGLNGKLNGLHAMVAHSVTLRQKQNEQMGRIVSLMTQLVERDRILRNVAEANRFMADPPKPRGWSSPNDSNPVGFTWYTEIARPEASAEEIIPTLGDTA